MAREGSSRALRSKAEGLVGRFFRRRGLDLGGRVGRRGGFARALADRTRELLDRIAGRQARRRHQKGAARQRDVAGRSEEHTSELQSLMRISYAVFCLKKKKK